MDIKKFLLNIKFGDKVLIAYWKEKYPNKDIPTFQAYTNDLGGYRYTEINYCLIEKEFKSDLMAEFDKTNTLVHMDDYDINNPNTFGCFCWKCGYKLGWYNDKYNCQFPKCVEYKEYKL